MANESETINEKVVGTTSSDNLEIEEVTETEDEKEEEESVIDGGKVEDWDPIKIRAQIVHRVLGVWVICIFTGLVHLIATGTPLALATLSPILLSSTHVIFNHYFSNGTNKPQGKYGKAPNKNKSSGAN